MADTLTLVGAYGRQYAAKATVLKEWNEGKDFQILNGPYCSIRDIEHMRMTNNHIVIRYGKGMDRFIIEI
jgi:hypothetical protein